MSAAERQEYEERIAALEHRVSLLAGREGVPGAALARLGLDPQQRALCMLLINRGSFRKSLAVEALYGDRPDGGPDQPEKMIDVRVCRMRPKLAAHGVEILTLWGEGYAVEDDSRRKLTMLAGIVT